MVPLMLTGRTISFRRGPNFSMTGPEVFGRGGGGTISEGAKFFDGSIECATQCRAGFVQHVHIHTMYQKLFSLGDCGTYVPPTGCSPVILDGYPSIILLDE